MKTITLTKDEEEVLSTYLLKKMSKLEELNLKDSRCYPLLSSIYYKLMKSQEDTVSDTEETITGPVYEVWLLGETADGSPSDFEQFLTQFELPNNAISFAQHFIHGPHAGIIAKVNSETDKVYIVVEKVMLHVNESECVDVVYKEQIL